VGGEDRTSGAAGTKDDADADADADAGVDTNAGAARPEGNRSEISSTTASTNATHPARSINAEQAAASHDTPNCRCSSYNGG
jgi:hypothetical protein